MKNIHLHTQKLDDQLDVDELASLTIDLWKTTRPELNPVKERFSNWIKNLVYKVPPLIVKVNREGKLIGWALLFIHDSKRLEINPWALGGHPHVVYDDPDKVKIAKLLLQECINYAMQNNYTRVEFCYEPKDNLEEYPIDPLIYPECNFLEVDEIVFMTRDLTEKQEEISQPDLPEDIETILLKDTSDSDFYSCFYDSFMESGARNFLSLADEGRREYFNSYYDRTVEMIDEASISLVKGTKTIGFTFVKPTHGEGNGNLYGIGVIPEFRGIQLGSRLLNHVMITLKRLGYETMSLAADVENEHAIKLYEKHKFVKEWRRITHAWKKPN